jgi:hypothetical protein
MVDKRSYAPSIKQAKSNSNWYVLNYVSVQQGEVADCLVRSRIGCLPWTHLLLRYNPRHREVLLETPDSSKRRSKRGGLSHRRNHRRVRQPITRLECLMGAFLGGINGLGKHRRFHIDEGHCRPGQLTKHVVGIRSVYDSADSAVNEANNDPVLAHS